MRSLCSNSTKCIRSLEICTRIKNYNIYPTKLIPSKIHSFQSCPFSPQIHNVHAVNRSVHNNIRLQFVANSNEPHFPPHDIMSRLGHEEDGAAEQKPRITTQNFHFIVEIVRLFGKIPATISQCDATNGQAGR